MNGLEASGSIDALVRGTFAYLGIPFRFAQGGWGNCFVSKSTVHLLIHSRARTPARRQFVLFQGAIYVV